MRVFGIPVSVLAGLLAAAGGVISWCLDHSEDAARLGQLNSVLKCIIGFAFALTLSDLSTRLHDNRRRTFFYFGTLIGVIVIAAALYLPWRESFCRHFNNGIYRWYWSGLLQHSTGHYGDFDDWLAGRRAGKPHLYEFGILLGFCGQLFVYCHLLPLPKWAGFLAALQISAYLALVPLFTGLLVWDYDTFLRGIAFDSVSADLFPFFLSSGSYSIFFFALSLLFFAVTAAFTRQQRAPATGSQGS